MRPKAGGPSVHLVRLCHTLMDSEKAKLAKQILDALEQGSFVPAHHAFRLRYWALPDEAAFPLADIARRILSREADAMASAVVFQEDPKYNGAHVCPRCGSRSQWRGTDADLRMISVQCRRDCGEYNMSYDQLSDGPHFKEDRISN